MHHYCYILRLRDGSRYIGSRSCECDPELDEYFGSASDPYVCQKNVVEKRIIDTFPTRREANEFERFLHIVHQVHKDPNFRNKVIAPSADCTGRPTTEKQREAARKTGKNSLGKIKTNNLSGFVGVSFDQRRQSWRAIINLNGIQYHLGYYKTAEEASAVYTKALKKVLAGEDPSSVKNKRIPSSKYKNVYRDKNRKKWVAEISRNGKRHRLGYFENEIDAAFAVKEAHLNLKLRELTDTA